MADMKNVYDDLIIINLYPMWERVCLLFIWTKILCNLFNKSGLKMTWKFVQIFVQIKAQMRIYKQFVSSDP